MNLLNPPVFLSEVSSDTSNKLSGAAEEAESDNMKTYLLSIETLTLLMIQRELRRVTLDTMSQLYSIRPTIRANWCKLPMTGNFSSNKTGT